MRTLDEAFDATIAELPKNVPGFLKEILEVCFYSGSAATMQMLSDSEEETGSLDKAVSVLETEHVLFRARASTNHVIKTAQRNARELS